MMLIKVLPNGGSSPHQSRALYFARWNQSGDVKWPVLVQSPYNVRPLPNDEAWAIARELKALDLPTCGSLHVVPAEAERTQR